MSSCSRVQRPSFVRILKVVLALQFLCVNYVSGSKHHTCYHVLCADTYANAYSHLRPMVAQRKKTHPSSQPKERTLQNESRMVLQSKVVVRKSCQSDRKTLMALGDHPRKYLCSDHPRHTRAIPMGLSGPSALDLIEAQLYV